MLTRSNIAQRAPRAARRRRQRGQILPLLALAAVAVVGASGVAVDGALAYGHTRDDQNLADGAALAATTYLSRHTTDTPSSRAAGAQAAATAVLNRNGTTATLSSLTPVDINGNPTSGKSWAQGTAWGTAAVIQSAHQTSLIRAVGAKSVSTGRSATAVYGYPSSVIGVIPVDINLDATTGGVGTTVCMSVAGGGGGGGCSVNAGTFTPPGCGSSDDACFAAAVRNGIGSPITLNTTYAAGSISSISAATAAAIQSRINADPSATATTYAAGSPRVVVLAVLNGDIGNPTVKPIAFETVFLQSVQPTPTNTLTVTLIRAPVTAGPGQSLGTSPPSGVDSTLNVKLIG